MSEKKTERLDVRVSHGKKQAFAQACEAQSDTPSNAIRRFVNSYIRRSKRDEASANLRAIFPRHSGKLALGLFVGLLAVFALKSTKLSDINTDALFAFYDYNNSGLIEIGEIAPNDIHLHRVLNINGDEGISPDEFIAKATMAWQFTNPEIKFQIETTTSGFLGSRKIVKYTQLSDVDFPDGAVLFPKDPEGEPISLETYTAENMSPSDLRSVSYEGRQAVGALDQVVINTGSSPYATTYVIFDLMDSDRPQIDVLKQTSIAHYSRSMKYKRLVFWVDGESKPHFIMGDGADTDSVTP